MYKACLRLKGSFEHMSSFHVDCVDWDVRRQDWNQPSPILLPLTSSLEWLMWTLLHATKIMFERLVQELSYVSRSH